MDQHSLNLRHSRVSYSLEQFLSFSLTFIFPALLEITGQVFVVVVFGYFCRTSFGLDLHDVSSWLHSGYAPLAGTPLHWCCVLLWILPGGTWLIFVAILILWILIARLIWCLPQLFTVNLFFLPLYSINICWRYWSYANIPFSIKLSAYLCS